MKVQLTVKTLHLLADLDTPVGIYLKVRDLFAESALLESSDYQSKDNSFSIIGVQPIASYKICDKFVCKQYPSKEEVKIDIQERFNFVESFQSFVEEFELSGDESKVNGFLGYTSYSAVKYLIPEVADKNTQSTDIPYFYQILYRFLIVIDHLSNELTLIENIPMGEASKIESFKNILLVNNISTFDFKKIGEEFSNINDEEQKQQIGKGIELCKAGTLSQIVLSKKYFQKFEGDEFNVYRTLRSINPSPYLFYFDFGSFKIFGSSPETHCKVKDNKVTIDPIAGTYFRTGDIVKDQELSRNLLVDTKEVGEHDMLVDFAKNDLTKHCDDVQVEFYKNVQFYSHVIHLVSRVSAHLKKGVKAIQILADTFPAGTLVGSPKLDALKYIQEIEKDDRGFYGGCIGYIGFNGDMSQAITIRSMLSQSNILHYQAGGGIVALSTVEKEQAEVKAKTQALRKAISEASNNNNPNSKTSSL